MPGERLVGITVWVRASWIPVLQTTDKSLACCQGHPAGKWRAANTAEARGAQVPRRDSGTVNVSLRRVGGWGGVGARAVPRSRSRYNLDTAAKQQLRD